MAFSFEWQSEAFSYGTNIGSSKKSKKRKNTPPVDTNGPADFNEVAAELACKKLSMFSMADSCDKSVTALPVDHVNLKSSLKSSHKRKKLSVSFDENSPKLNSLKTNEDSKLSELNCMLTTNVKKSDKKLKKAAKKQRREQQALSDGNRMEGMGIQTIASNVSEHVKSQVHLEESVDKAINASKPSVSTASNGKVSDKKLKKAAKKQRREQQALSDGNRMEGMGIQTIASNVSEHVKSQVRLEESVDKAINASKPSVSTATNGKQLNGKILGNTNNKQVDKGRRKGFSKDVDEMNPDIMNSLSSPNQSSIEQNSNDMNPPGEMEKKKAPNSKIQKQIKEKKNLTSLFPSVILKGNDKKIKNSLEIKKTPVNKRKLINEVVKSSSDGSDDEWSDCEDEFSHVSDDGPEVQEFDEEVGEDKLDATFHKDLENLLDDLDFAGLKKRMMTEPGTHVEHESSEVEDSESDGWEDASGTDIKDSEVGEECMEDDNRVKEELKKREIPLPKKKDMKIKALPNVNISKLSASLALFNQHQPTSSEMSVTNKPTSSDALIQKMRTKLNVAKFRMINEQLYSTTGSEALQLFKREPESFRVYHDGFKSQVALWPLNPLDIIVDWLKQQPRQLVVADFGCGEAELSERVSQRVHSLDLVATKPQVTVCDMARTPLASQTVDVAVFCLSLMGTNVSDFITEANRTLKLGGIMKIAEVESRITNLEEFVATVQKFGFKCNKKPVNHQYFVTMEFKKFKNSKAKDSLPQIKLKPCLYKKR